MQVGGAMRPVLPSRMGGEAFEKWVYLPHRLFLLPVVWEGREQGNAGSHVLKVGRVPVLEGWQRTICCQNEHLTWTVIYKREILFFSFFFF